MTISASMDPAVYAALREITEEELRRPFDEDEQRRADAILARCEGRHCPALPTTTPTDDRRHWRDEDH